MEVENDTADVGTRAEILTCAARLFRTQGYAAVSLREIAKGVGLTTGSLYYHFASKEEIVSEILDQGHRRVLQEVQKGITALGPEADGRMILRTAILKHIECLLGDDSFPSANIRIFAHVPAEVRRESLGVRHEYESYWIRLLRRCQERGESDAAVDPPVLANLLFGAMNWTIEWYKPGSHRIEDVAESLTRLVIHRQYPAKPTAKSRSKSTSSAKRHPRI
ncbi:TetR/AcrR family transcriptional regulator [Nitrobacteraceae bacterium UC4446_H13]